ncbi:uncharacterized protein DUF2628 [Orbus hercynius]|uniref:Uncharacterized protein DUF2628 n=1 Tax=Orbus hercynius TaxID=593135 RepID=A0A495RF56_9GAMM|nr:DUF2628 domain-containing protein [Orbus hercynius]RKS86025.1 uncharacterized protein DUF2628 [Orbus hercynius]
MKNYKLFKHDDGRIEAVKQGWSWPGFVLEIFGLGFIWGLVKKLWFVAILLIIFRIALFIISDSVSPDMDGYTSSYQYQNALNTALMWSIVFFIVQLAVAIVIGVQGNSLREKNLISKGYELVGTAEALNPDMAIFEMKKAESQHHDIVSHL